MRGLDYYCHTVFEVISDDPRLGAGATVGGSGRYNGLVQELGGPEAPGVGFFWNGTIIGAMDEELEEPEVGCVCYANGR